MTPPSEASFLTEFSGTLDRRTYLTQAMRQHSWQSPGEEWDSKEGSKIVLMCCAVIWSVSRPYGCVPAEYISETGYGFSNRSSTSLASKLGSSVEGKVMGFKRQRCVEPACSFSIGQSFGSDPNVGRSVDEVVFPESE